jgi:maleylacetoacetate isomerase
MSTKPKLFSYWRSSCSWRVRIALALKDVDYDTEAVHLIKDGGQQRAQEFKDKNPMSQIPVLQYEGVNLTQSLAIINFLEEMHPKPSLLPHDPFKRAQARAIAETIASGIQPLQNSSSVLQRIGDEKKMEWAHDMIQKGMAAVEAMLEKTAGTYCVGDEVSIADLCLIPQIYNAQRFKVDLKPFPNLMKVNKNCEELDAFKKAHPNVQPDCPEDQKAT